MPDAPRVLVADDEAVVRAVVAEVLESELGADVLHAADGLEAVAAAAARRPRLVLLDLRMPLLDGFGALERLRSMPQTAAIPVLALSGSVDPRDAARALAGGCAGVVTKPFDIWELAETVRPFLAA